MRRKGRIPEPRRRKGSAAGAHVLDERWGFRDCGKQSMIETKGFLVAVLCVG